MHNIRYTFASLCPLSFPFNNPNPSNHLVVSLPISCF